MRRVLFVNAGDAETLAAIPVLADRYAAAVVTLSLDVGQDGHTMALRDRALAAGALRAHVIDVREEFARDYVLKLLHAGAVRTDAAGQGAALLRSLVVEKLLEVAAMEGATFVAHGFAPQSGDAAYLERAIRLRRPEWVVIAAAALTPDASGSPVRPQPGVDRHRVLALESTLWWRRIVLQAAVPSAARISVPAARAGLFTVVTPDRCPSVPASLALTFKEGVPVAINGIEMPLVELIEAADTIAGDHGIGRVATTVEKDGAWRTEIVESPAAIVLSTAYEALARAVASPALWQIQRHLGRRYADLLRSGQWMSDAREALDVFAAGTRQHLSGTVRLTLRRGRCRVIARDVTTPRESLVNRAVPGGSTPRLPATSDRVPVRVPPAVDVSLPH